MGNEWRVACRLNGYTTHALGDWSAKMAEIVPIPHNVSCSLDVCRCVHSAWVMWNVETPNDVSAVRAAVLSAGMTHIPT